MEIVCCGNVTGGSNPLLCAKENTPFSGCVFLRGGFEPLITKNVMIRFLPSKTKIRARFAKIRALHFFVFYVIINDKLIY